MVSISLTYISDFLQQLYTFIDYGNKAFAG